MLETAKFAPSVPSDLAATLKSQAASCRFDPIQGNWTIFAPYRQERPHQFNTIRTPVENEGEDCPFCRGHESNTPAPVWVGKQVNECARSDTLETLASLAMTNCLGTVECVDDPEELVDSANVEWMVRVVPNKYPAISPLGTDANRPSTSSTNLFKEQTVLGGHEVIIESPIHHKSIVELDATNLALVFAAYRDRIRHWHDVDGISYISLFKNSGGEAGASLVHSHSQLIATGMMPNRVQLSVNRMLQYRAQTGCCLQCDLVRAELKDKSRIIAKTDGLVAFCPFASEMPMSIRITTMDHHDRFETLSDSTIESVSFLVKRVASWIERLRPGVSYNYLINTRPPAADDCGESYHWSLDIFPRIARIAGFELSSDCMINSVMPEIAAAQFRGCASAEDPRVVL